MGYTEPKVRGVRWADIMDALDRGEDLPLRRTLRSTIQRRKQAEKKDDTILQTACNCDEKKLIHTG